MQPEYRLWLEGKRIDNQDNQVEGKRKQEQCGEFDESQRPKLSKLFRAALVYLLVITIASLLTAIALVQQASTVLPVFIAIVAGVVGSGASALVSCLDRRATGFEDTNGFQTPWDGEPKHRFNEGMFYWFLARPCLGAIVAALVFWGMASEFFVDQAAAETFRSSPERIAFYGLLAGLFSKSILEILRGLLEKIFKT